MVVKKIMLVLGILIIAISCTTALNFNAISIDGYQSGLTNQVKLHLYAETNESVISYCDIRSGNDVDENIYYWSSNPYSLILNRTVVVEKNDDYKIRLYCVDINNSVASSNFISIKSSQAIPDWLVWACLLGSVLLLIYAFRSENMLYGIFASLSFLLFVKMSEGAFLTDIESLVALFFWIKVVFATCLVILIAQIGFKQSKKEIKA